MDQSLNLASLEIWIIPLVITRKKMGSENHIFCSLCLCRIWDKNAEEIKDCTREILDLIFVNRNLPLSIGQKFCQICSTKIQDAFNFKCMCVGTTKGSLKDAYTSKNGYGELLDMLSGQKMCRLCLQLADGSFTSLLNEREREVIREYIPEMTLENTWDPVACETCIRSLYNYVAFINQCIHAQEKRNRSSLSEIACFNGRDYALTENNEKFKKQSEIETQEDKQVIVTKCMNR
ncbi:hypothetical protein NQ315_011049 [Exocentrus adspersus]|uniref:ZAD domain-containing protein n=1 Tax=Exocentrus adspersus TaxID=1586481 RepID=A0AAV8V8V2_9CUCU|nr:hypothetical protein NQ315_011049 [Exocentrus adspersus]